MAKQKALPPVPIDEALEYENTIEFEVEPLIAECTADVFGRKLDFLYRADRFTADLVKSNLSVQEALIKLVTNWGLKREGRMVPLTPEGLATVPTSLLFCVWNAIVDDYEPSPKWRSLSPCTSLPAGGADTAPSSTP